MSFSIEILLGCLAVIAAITVPLIIYFLQKSKKRLAYEIVSNTQLVGVKSEVQNKIKIYYENKLVENVHLLLIRIINNGNQSISIGDFAKRIDINLGNNLNILTCEILRQYPDNLDINVIKMVDSIEIEPLLLNPKDNFTIKILLSDYKENFEVSARIEGISKIEVYKEPQPLFNITLMLTFIPFLILMITRIFFEETFKNYFGFDISIIVHTFFVLIITILVFQILKIWYEAAKEFFLKDTDEE